jgi:hypothetical protein
MQPSGFKFIKIKHLCCKAHRVIFPNYEIHRCFVKPKSRGPCLKPLLLIILISSLSHCPYQKDERAKPGNLPTKQCFSLPPKLRVSYFSHAFPFHLLYYYSMLWEQGRVIVTDVHRYVTIIKLRYSVSQHTSSIHTLAVNSNLFTQDFSSVRLPIQCVTSTGSWSRWAFSLLSPPPPLPPEFQRVNSPFTKFKTLSY